MNFSFILVGGEGGWGGGAYGHRICKVSLDSALLSTLCSAGDQPPTRRPGVSTPYGKFDI
jgi:hypothetical protein